MPTTAGRGRGRRPLARRPRQPRGRAGAPAALRRLVAAQGQARTPASTRCSAALREIEEETGSTARPGRRLGSLRYLVPEGRKRVRYWACEATGGTFEVNSEVDEIWWAPLAEAKARLDPAHDARVLKRFAADTRRTRSIVVVRHASAGDKRAWAGDDADRPLDRKGLAQSVTIGALLTAYGVERAGSADVRALPRDPGPARPAAGVDVEVLPATTAGGLRRRHGEGVPRGPGPGDEHEAGRSPGAASAR